MSTFSAIRTSVESNSKTETGKEKKRAHHVARKILRRHRSDSTNTNGYSLLMYNN